MWHESDWYETKIYGNGNLKMRYLYYCVHETLQIFTEEMLKKYTGNSIVKVGSALLWHFHNGYLERDKLITSYGHQIIALALASPLNSTNHSCEITIEGFRLLCRAYNGIKTKETSKIFLKEQTIKLVDSLKNFPDEKTKIPLEFIKDDVCYEVIKLRLIARLAVSQNSDDPSENLIFTAYRKFKLLNEFTKGQSGIDFETQFGMDALSYFRSVFLMFSLGKDKDRNGIIKFETLSVSKGFKDKYNHSAEKCRLFSSKLSCSDGDLTDWYKDILSTNETQKYYPNLLFDNPIINSKKFEGGSFLIPSPTIFLKRASNFLFSSLVRNDESTHRKGKSTMSTKIGDIKEEHIKQILIEIFGEKNVEKVNHSGEKADFRITLDECILIIELKSSISGDSREMYPQYCLMSTDYIAKIWSNLYKACRQCKSSIDNTEDKSKPIITIILIEDYLPRGVAALFQMFGEKSGLFKSLDMNFVHLFSWNHIEDRLSKTSILKFVTSLLHRQNFIPAIFAELLDPLPNLELDHENPAHNFNYFENEKNEILGRSIS